LSEQKAVTVKPRLKGPPFIRQRQRESAAYRALGEVLLRVPVEEVTDPLFGGDEDRPISFPKFWQEIPERFYEHYNYDQSGRGIWCELLVKKDIADAIVAAHPKEAQIREEKDDNLMRS
jgi:hypothetical protein